MSVEDCSAVGGGVYGDVVEKGDAAGLLVFKEDHTVPLPVLRHERRYRVGVEDCSAVGGGVSGDVVEKGDAVGLLVLEDERAVPLPVLRHGRRYRVSVEDCSAVGGGVSGDVVEKGDAAGLLVLEDERAVLLLVLLLEHRDRPSEKLPPLPQGAQGVCGGYVDVVVEGDPRVRLRSQRSVPFRCRCCGTSAARDVA